MTNEDGLPKDETNPVPEAESNPFPNAQSIPASHFGGMHQAAPLPMEGGEAPAEVAPPAGVEQEPTLEGGEAPPIPALILTEQEGVTAYVTALVDILNAHLPAVPADSVNAQKIYKWKDLLGELETFVLTEVLK